jgi:hypothetical protein
MLAIPKLQHCYDNLEVLIRYTYRLAPQSDYDYIVLLTILSLPDNTADEDRALSYPDNFQAHRTRSLEYSHWSELVVDNFVDRGIEDFKLVAFSPKDQQGALDENQMLNLDAAQCSFMFERSDGEDIILVWMPSGNLRVCALVPMWMLIADIQVIADMTSVVGL